MTDAERELLERVDALADEQIKLTQDLVAIPTVTAHTAHEHAEINRLLNGSKVVALTLRRLLQQ